MRNDKDLLFLQECRNEDLKTLVDYLTNDKNGEIRFSEQLTNTDAHIRNYPHSLNQMWREAANELRRYGGNTIVNLLSGHGIQHEYRIAFYSHPQTSTRAIEIDRWKESYNYRHLRSVFNSQRVNYNSFATF